MPGGRHEEVLLRGRRPGCEASWVCSTEDDILARVAAHARADHGMTDIPAELVSAVRSHIVTVD